MTYYKYVKRNADSQTNWAEVTKGISDTLIATRDAREEKRQKIEEQSRKFGDLLDNAPQGDNLEFNKLTLDMAEQSKELRRIQDNLLRSGMMSVKDYNMARQTMSDDWDNFTTFATEANEEYAKKMKDYQDGLISRQTLDEMSIIEGFSNFTQTKGHVDHMTGRLGLAKRTEDGIDETSVMSINEMRNRLKRTVNRVNVIDELNPAVQSLGQHIEVMRSAGILTEENILRRDLNPDDEEVVSTYRRAQEDYINSIITSPDKASSILLDTIGLANGKQIETVFAASEEEAERIKAKGDDAVLVLKRDPKSGNYFADITDSQRDMIVSTLRDQMDVMLDIKQTPEPIDMQARAEARAIGRGEKEQLTPVMSIAQLWYGDENEVRQALDSLKNTPIGKNVGKSIESIERTPEGVIVDYIDNADGKASQTFAFYDEEGNLKTQEEFAQSIASFFGITDITKALKSSEYDPNRKFGTGVGRSEITREAPPKKAFEQQFTVVDGEAVSATSLIAEITGELSGTIFKDYEFESTAPQINAAIEAGLKELPPDAKRNMSYGIKEYDGDQVVQVYLPSVTDLPINIPASANVGSELTTVLRKIYDAGQNGIKLTRDDFSQMITDFSKFNSDAADKEIGVKRQQNTTSGTNPSGGNVR